MGLPGYWTVLFVRAEVEHPAGRTALSPIAVTLLLPSSTGTLLASGIRLFRGCILSARTFACLRIDTHRYRAYRKARYRPAGLSFGRAGFAPAGRFTEFQLTTERHPPFGPAFPGRFPCSIPPSAPRRSKM